MSPCLTPHHTHTSLLPPQATRATLASPKPSPTTSSARASTSGRAAARSPRCRRTYGSLAFALHAPPYPIFPLRRQEPALLGQQFIPPLRTDDAWCARRSSEELGGAHPPPLFARPRRLTARRLPHRAPLQVRAAGAGGRPFLQNEIEGETCAARPVRGALQPAARRGAAVDEGGRRLRLRLA